MHGGAGQPLGLLLACSWTSREKFVKSDTVRIGDIDLELFEGGSGAPLFLLHGGQGFSADHPYVGPLARERRLLAPSHPGFGRSTQPDWIDSVDDIAHVYLDLLALLGLDKIEVVGCSIGGWIAAEIATMVPARLSKLILVGPVGGKIGPADKLDSPDIFAIGQPAVMRLLYHDPDRFRMKAEELSEDQLLVAMRNRESLALVTWERYMHNPKLKRR